MQPDDRLHSINYARRTHLIFYVLATSVGLIGMFIWEWIIYRRMLMNLPRNHTRRYIPSATKPVTGDIYERPDTKKVWNGEPIYREGRGESPQDN